MISENRQKGQERNDADVQSHILKSFCYTDVCCGGPFLVEYAADAESSEADDIKGNIYRHEKHRCGGHGV